jgi:hypothetical protein
MLAITMVTKTTMYIYGVIFTIVEIKIMCLEI